LGARANLLALAIMFMGSGVVYVRELAKNLMKTCDAASSYIHVHIARVSPSRHYLFEASAASHRTGPCLCQSAEKIAGPCRFRNGLNTKPR